VVNVKKKELLAAAGIIVLVCFTLYFFSEDSKNGELETPKAQKPKTLSEVFNADKGRGHEKRGQNDPPSTNEVSSFFFPTLGRIEAPSKSFMISFKTTLNSDLDWKWKTFSYQDGSFFRAEYYSGFGVDYQHPSNVQEDTYASFAESALTPALPSKHQPKQVVEKVLGQVDVLGKIENTYRINITYVRHKYRTGQNAFAEKDRYIAEVFGPICVRSELRDQAWAYRARLVFDENLVLLFSDNIL
jgi:hypothetical protein